MRRFLVICALLLPLMLQAQKEQMAWDGLRHEIRVGWGDPIFESGMKYELTHIGKPNAQITYLTGHFFAEYQYYWLHWLSTGMIVDYSGMGWLDKREDPQVKHSYYNLSLLPTVRFTYYHHPWVNLYSALMIGLTVNGGTEANHVTHEKTVCYPGIGLTALGVQVGHNGFFGTAEIGGLTALKSTNDIAMLSSRIFTISFGYKFN